ncbi:hypothetical protein [Maridesulfovibrio ferrireducens]|uniref:hypothetical protein n=1 Tax=Maridesulfovibrio ferrireducens TaxID=246191 RepID=UPI001A2AABD1|nr:hypothetical protein [Maridesulfovibrio ferrireducens]MBI9110079.1 hypothetical protein [Maridesulfovibrio ferrireducens]
MKKQITERHKIKGFDYEVDEKGRVFSTKNYPGYGIGWQMMPTKPGLTRLPQYTLRRDGESFVFRVDLLVEKYFDSTEFFDGTWFRKMRAESKKHKALMRATFLESKKLAKETGKAINAPAPEKSSHTEKKTTPNTYIPWSNTEQLIENCRIDESYSAALGGDSRDAQMCPLR